MIMIMIIIIIIIYKSAHNKTNRHTPSHYYTSRYNIHHNTLYGNLTYIKWLNWYLQIYYYYYYYYYYFTTSSPVTNILHVLSEFWILLLLLLSSPVTNNIYNDKLTTTYWHQCMIYLSSEHYVACTLLV